MANPASYGHWDIHPQTVGMWNWFCRIISTPSIRLTGNVFRNTAIFGTSRKSSYTHNTSVIVVGIKRTKRTYSGGWCQPTGHISRYTERVSIKFGNVTVHPLQPLNSGEVLFCSLPTDTQNSTALLEGSLPSPASSISSSNSNTTTKISMEHSLVKWCWQGENRSTR
jgi:hypothetical protein